MRHSWAKAAQSELDCGGSLISFGCVVGRRSLNLCYHFSIASLLRGIDQSFCHCLAPVDACAEDIKE